MARTQQLLAAIGDPDGFALLDVLRIGPRKQTALAKEAGVPAGTASARIEVMVALGLVSRPTARGELSINQQSALEAVISAADSLTGALLREQLQEHERRTGPPEARDPEGP